MKTRRLISRFFAAAFVIVVLQQLAVAPATRTAASIEQRAVNGATSKRGRQSLPASNISQAWSVTAVNITLNGEEPRLCSSSSFSLFRFQRPPPAA